MTIEETQYETAVEALLSPLHQAVTKEEIALTSARRTRTVQDMRFYWNIITKNQCESNGRLELKEGGGVSGGPFSPASSSSSTFTTPARLIHITGTKGKGSTACLCESIMRGHGYSTGLFTSPHLMDIRERMRWNGRLIHKHIFGRVYWKIRNALEMAAAARDGAKVNGVAHSDDTMDDIPPTLPGYFRMLTLMGLYTFLVEIPTVDVLILEVGMGGRYDITNFLNEDVFKQRACGVALLDYDHVRILGNTLEKIAWEKGGIFAVDKLSPDGVSPRDFAPEEPMEDDENLEPGARRRQYYLLDSNPQGVIQMMQSCARIEGCGGNIVLVDASGKSLKAALAQRPLGLAGEHQYGNATLAVALCQEVTVGSHNNDGLEKVQSRIQLTSTTTLDALANASWPARCQTLECENFTLSLDGAHTPQSLKAAAGWFVSKLDKPVNGSNGDKLKPVLVFNCSHERNPVEFLMTLASRVAFSKVFFAKSNSSKPSPIDEDSAETLLMEHGIPIRPELLPKTLDQAKVTWQETLASIWKHLTYDVTHNVESALSTDNSIYCNMTATQVLQELSSIAESQSTNPKDLEAPEPPLQVLVTGSLYLVGSFLAALEWTEESSPAE
jgi:folylpolyglutamate synthase